jgi:hypothetical protein
LAIILPSSSFAAWVKVPEGYEIGLNYIAPLVSQFNSFEITLVELVVLYLIYLFYVNSPKMDRKPTYLRMFEEGMVRRQINPSTVNSENLRR